MSKPYMISYDLHSPGQKYEDIKSTIQKWDGSSIKLLDSFWLVRTSITPSSMAESLEKVIDENDSLFICEITSNYQGFLPKDDWPWIKKNIFNMDF